MSSQPSLPFSDSPVDGVWKAWCDGASRGNPGPASFGVVLCDPSGKVVEEVGRALGRDTNQAAEYEALLCALDEFKKRGVRRAVVYTDSQFVVRQFDGTYKARDERMKTFVARARDRAAAVGKVELVHIPRSSHPHNVRADALANRALDDQKKLS